MKMPPSKAPSFILALGSAKDKGSKSHDLQEDDEDLDSEQDDDKDQHHQMQLSAMDDFLSAIESKDSEKMLEAWTDLCDMHGDSSDDDDEEYK
jgi:hypothetical protein